jgi:hypothetical protein
MEQNGGHHAELAEVTAEATHLLAERQQASSAKDEAPALSQTSTEARLVNRAASDA